MNIEKTIAENVQRLRKAKGLNQEELSKKIPLQQAQLSNIENGKTIMTVKTLSKIAKALGVPVYELLKEDDLDSQGLKQKLEEIEKLPEDKKRSLLIMLDVFLREHKLQEVAKGK